VKRDGAEVYKGKKRGQRGNEKLGEVNGGIPWNAILDERSSWR